MKPKQSDEIHDDTSRYVPPHIITYYEQKTSRCDATIKRAKLQSYCILTLFSNIVSFTFISVEGLLLLIIIVKELGYSVQ